MTTAKARTTKAKIEFMVGKVKYQLRGDAHSWQLSRWTDSKWAIEGWYHTLEAVAKQIFEMGLRDSGASTFAELLQVGKGLRSEVRSAFDLWETS